MPEEATIRQLTEVTRQQGVALLDATDELRTVGQKLDLTHRMVRAQRIIIVIVLAVMVVMLAVLIALGAVAQRNRSTFNLVRDCTTPKGECYQRGQAQTGEAIQRLLAEEQRQHDKIVQKLGESK